MTIPKLVDSFLQLREECWPGSSTYPQARTPLNLQAQDLLETFKSYKPEFIDAEMRAHFRWRAQQGFARPYRLDLCKNALQNAGARAKAGAKKDPNDKFMAAMTGQHVLWLKRMEGWAKSKFWLPDWGERPPNCKNPDACRAMKEMGIG